MKNLSDLFFHKTKKNYSLKTPLVMWGHLCSTNNKINHKTQKYTSFIKKKEVKVIVLYKIESIADIIDYSAINTYQKKGLKKINVFVPA